MFLVKGNLTDLVIYCPLKVCVCVCVWGANDSKGVDE